MIKVEALAEEMCMKILKLDMRRLTKSRLFLPGQLLSVKLLLRDKLLRLREQALLSVKLQHHRAKGLLLLLSDKLLRLKDRGLLLLLRGRLLRLRVKGLLLLVALQLLGAN
jgi:hypothetical protein